MIKELILFALGFLYPGQETQWNLNIHLTSSHGETMGKHGETIDMGKQSTFIGDTKFG